MEKLDVSETTLTAEELNLLLNAKGGYVRLPGKGWRELEFNLTPEENEQLAQLGLSSRELNSEPQRLYALQLADAAARKFLPEEQAVQIERRASELKARVTPEVPGGVRGPLRPYQTSGFHFLAYLAANQAIDRTHCIGQAKTIIAYRLLIKNSIEEKTRTLKKQKRALAEDVLGEEKFAASLTLEDLRYLLAD